MIQFKKKPLSKSALLLLLFLTTNVHGFLQDYRNEHETVRKDQNRFSMDLQQPTTRNMPIRRTGIDRVINAKDGNAERLYDRRSFRTGTIQGTETTRDINNNRQRFTANLQTRYTRDDRRSFEPSISRENRRFSERAVISTNRQYNERSLSTRAERNLNHRVERSNDARDRRNLQINEERGTTESRSNERLDARTIQRELPQRQVNNRRVDERSTRLTTDRSSTESSRRSSEIRRSVRSADVRDRRVSQVDNRDQIRSAERSERVNFRENLLERRSTEDHNRRMSERRLTFKNHRVDQSRTLDVHDRRAFRNSDVDQRRLSSDERNRDQRLSPERLERSSTEDYNRRTNERRLSLTDHRADQRRILDARDRRTFESRSVDQRRLSPEERHGFQRQASERYLERTSSRENPLERRTIDIRNIGQRQISSAERSIDQRQSSERLDRVNSRENTSERHIRDARVQRIRNVNQQRLLSSEERNGGQRRSVERLERMNSRQTSLQRHVVEHRDRRIYENRNEDQRRSSCEERNVSSERLRSLNLKENRDRRSPERSTSSVERLGREFKDRRSNQIRLSNNVSTRANPERDNIRTARKSQQTVRDQTRRDTQELSRQLTRAYQYTAQPVRNQNRAYQTRETTSRLQRIDSRNIRAVPLQTRVTDRTVDNRRVSQNDRTINTRDRSRSDSTRYIQDNTYSRNTHTSSRVSRVDERETQQSRITDRYNPLTADSRRYFEKIVSQRAASNTEVPAANMERNININNYAWTSTAKIALIAFLIGQIFVNSSKANKCRFYNVLSMATSIKEKIQ